jgi:hypothetical protein
MKIENTLKNYSQLKPKCSSKKNGTETSIKKNIFTFKNIDTKLSDCTLKYFFQFSFSEFFFEWEKYSENTGKIYILFDL